MYARAFSRNEPDKKAGLYYPCFQVNSLIIMVSKQVQLPVDTRTGGASCCQDKSGKTGRLQTRQLESQTRSNIGGIRGYF